MMDTRVIQRQDRPMDFNVTKYKSLIDVILDSPLQLIFKKLLLILEFWRMLKNVHNYLKSLLK